MENLFLPILVVVILTIAAVINYVDGKPERKERVPKVIGKALALVVVTVTLSILFGGVLYGAFAEEEIVKGTRIRVKISPYGETLDAEVKEQEPIWFPPFFLLGVVAPTEKKFKRAQKMPPDFYLPCSLFDKSTYVVYFTNNKKCFIKTALSEALEYVRRAECKGIAAFVCTFVEEYKQQAVVACNFCDFLEYWRGTPISDRINDAYKALTIGIITNNVEPKLEEVQVIEVKYSNNDDDPEAFAPSPEEIEDFEAMREAYSPGGYRDF